MTNALTNTLGPSEARLWQEYLTAEAQGQRSQFLPRLRLFVEALQAVSEDDRYQFAEAFCRKTADEGASLPVREPLFAGIIGPYLVSAYQRGDGNAGRWIAHYYRHFLNMTPSQGLIELPDPLSPRQLLTEAFQRDPVNPLTQDALLKLYAQQFDYAVHEVPSGVLFGPDGAMVAECHEWLHDLALFREVVQRRSVAEKYEVAIRYWDFHFRGYADYLTHREQYQNYAEYIERHWESEV